MPSTTVQRAAPCGISALISGAGVGGLVAALELWRRGCDVRIFERSKASMTSGDTFHIGPSAMNFLKHWPEMEREHDKISYTPLFAYCSHTGDYMFPPRDMTPMHNNTSPEGQKLLIYQHSRPKFHTMLLEQLTRCGLSIEFSMNVIDYYEDVSARKAGVVTKDGTKYDADLVVAADGLHGKSWGLVAGQPMPAYNTGMAMFRAAYPIDLVIKDPLIAERFKLQEDGRSTFEIWTGSDMFGTFWRNDESMMWSITHQDEGAADESWAARVDSEDVLDLMSRFPDWPEAVNRVIKATPPDTIVDWRLMWRDPRNKWTSPGGLVIQVGDAAHAFLPSGGNGATQAIEDAISLAACIGIAGKEHISDATRVHNLLRLERVSFLQAAGVARQASRLSSTLRDDKAPKRKEPPMFSHWLMAHDPEEYTVDKFDEALSHLNDGTPFESTNRPRDVEYRPWTIDGLRSALEKGEPTILDGDWS